MDYRISYELGQVTFLNPEALFGAAQAQVTARFEEQGHLRHRADHDLRAVHPLCPGRRGAINFIGLYQKEQSAFNRPPLGFEATANLVDRRQYRAPVPAPGLTRLLSGLTSRPAVAPSRLDFNAEVAMTKPDPNRSGQAYIEEFEAEAGVPISLQETAWEFGSAPKDPSGAADFGFAGGFEPG